MNYFFNKNGPLISTYFILAIVFWLVFLIIIPQLYMLDLSFRPNLPPLLRGGRVDKKDIINSYKYSQAQRFATLKDMYKNIDAARKLGISNAKIANKVKRKGLKTDLINNIKKQIRYKASPRHVPTKVISINDIPRTKNGKIVELAVKSTIEGNEIQNMQALANPEVLKEYKNLKELKN